MTEPDRCFALKEPIVCSFPESLLHEYVMGSRSADCRVSLPWQSDVLSGLTSSPKAITIITWNAYIEYHWRSHLSRLFWGHDVRTDRQMFGGDTVSTQEAYERLRHIAMENHCDIFGVADMTPAFPLFTSEEKSYLTRFPKGISFGMHFVDSLVDAIAEDVDNISAQHAFVDYIYYTLGRWLDDVGVLIARELTRLGAAAYPLYHFAFPVSPTMYGAVSHKMIAHLAGLGFIGKNCLLVNATYGPRLWLGSVLTDAELPTGLPIARGRECEECMECIRRCPVNALNDVPFRVEEPRDKRFNAMVCAGYFAERGKKGFPNYEMNCSLCMAVCPYGHRAARNIVSAPTT